MTQDEMLRHLALSRPELHDLVRKSMAFLETLNPAQQEAVRRSIPTADAAARTLGPDVTAEDLRRLLRESGPQAPADGGTFMFEGALFLKNPE
jgi:hypothetical protein